MKLSQKIAEMQNCTALITGESVGQVASQTMYALACTDCAADMPVFRPCIGMDKEEIIAVSRKIDTFDISIQPYEDCCTVFTPKHPKTRPHIDDVIKAEQKIPNLDEMLEKEDVDILDICLPTFLHADFAVKAMEKGINVICEKPISLKREDVQRVYSTAKNNNVCFMIAQVLRFWPEYEVVKSIYDSGKYGKLLSASMRRLGGIPKWSWDDWMRDEKRSGLVPFDLHIHDLDFIVYAFGKPEKCTTRRIKRPEQDYITATYDFGDFFISTEAAWFAGRYPFSARFMFQFEDAVVTWENDEMTIYESDGAELHPVTQDGEDTGDIGLPKSNAYANEIRYFADCVKSGVFPDKVKPEELETVIDILKAI